MANELRCCPGLTGLTIYAVCVNKNGLFLNGMTPEVYSESNWTSYAINCTEIGVTQHYRGTMTGPANRYTILFYSQAGSPKSPSDRLVAELQFDWCGSTELVYIGRPIVQYAGTDSSCC